MTSPAFASIEVRTKPGSPPRFFLHAQELHAGAAPALEMRLIGDATLEGYFDIRVDSTLRYIPTFNIAFRYPSTSTQNPMNTVATRFDIPPDATFRWPAARVHSSPPSIGQ